MSRDRFTKLLIYDLALGSRQNALKISAGLILLCFLCAMAAVQFRFVNVAPGFTGYVAGIIGGVAEYTPQEGGDFILPVSWLVLNLYGLFLTCTYTFSDLRTSGKYSMLLSSSRGAWWLSKCLWIAMCSLLYYAALYLMILAGCLVSDNGVAVASTQVFEFMGMNEVNDNINLLHMLLMPPVAFTATALLQAAVSLVFGPIIGYGMSVIQLVLSVYCKTPWLIGNYMMLARISPFVPDGLNPIMGYILSLGTTLLATMAGIMLIKKRNIME